MAEKIKVLFAAAECSPLAKVGGLADVVGSLPKALKKRGIDARVIIPFYESINKKIFSPKLIKKDLPIIVGGKHLKFDLYSTKYQDVTIYLIYNREYISQGEIYKQPRHKPGGLWEKERFFFFTESLIQALPHLNSWPDILHLNDWHTGMVPKFLSFKTTADPHYKKIKTIFTIHNLAMQGVWPATEILPWLDMTEYDFDKKDLQNGNINPLLFGIRHSDLITTVSPTYTKEITTKKYGAGLEKFLKKRRENLFGILNGIDTNKFNPISDPFIYNNYDEQSLEVKNTNKQKLLKEVDMEFSADKPLIGLVSRLVWQKGIDWVVDLIPKLKKLNAQLIILGTGDPELEHILKQAQAKYPKNCRVLIKFDSKLAQKIYAASDMFLIPSRFEPCGLTQMIAMRYGTIPIARATGGLKDSIDKFQQNNKKISGTGFLFKSENSKALNKAVKKACRVYKNKRIWQLLQKNAMKKDFSWEKSASEYIKLYKKLISS